jgi:transcriptional regulator with XRE-family HTH domain
LQKGISQIELAHRCDLEKGNMFRIESGGTNPTFRTLLKVAKALDISIEELVKGTDEV